jgi:TusA-related sulfurtransferase
MNRHQITIDARGLSCPIPQMRTLEAIKTLERGEIIVLMDEGAACESVIRAAKAMGLPYRVQTEGQDFIVTISKEEELWVTRLISGD